jgi:N-acetylglucosaminyl-diphospho-decaprenol L-rhamnosyltransferase
MTTTSVVVVAYRSCAHLERGLPVLLADPAVGDVVVVDNSQDAGTADLVARTGGRVRYVDPGGNVGFAKGCNLGARLTQDPVVTFLNPDVLLTRGLADLVEACLADESSVRAGGLTTVDGGDHLGNARRRATLPGELRRAVLGARSSLRPLPTGEEVVEVDQVDGALLMTSRAFLERLGGLDERYELYFEDVELCDRARAAGSVAIDTRQFGVHAGGASAKRAAATSYCVFRVSRVRYFAARGGLPGALAALAVCVVEVVVRTVTRQPESLGVRLRALRLAAQETVRPGSVAVLS